MITRRRFIAGLAAIPLAVKALFQPSTTLASLSALKGKTVSTALYQNIPTSEALERVVDAAGWPTGKTTMSYWWLDDEDAVKAYEQLLAIEE